MVMTKRRLCVPGDTPDERKAKEAAQKYFDELVETCGGILGYDATRDASRFYDGYLQCLTDKK